MSTMCEEFEVYQSLEDSDQLVMAETSISAEAQERHFHANVLPSGALEKVSSLVTAPIRPGYFVKL